MKKNLFWLALAIGVVMVTSCNNSDLEAMQRTNDSLQQVVDTKEGEIDALFEMMNQIEENLAIISAKYGKVQELKNNNVEGNGNIKGEINEQISTIESMLEANKKKIGELNARISGLGKENTKLQEFVARLEERITNQESQIAELMRELENNKVIIQNLNQNVSELSASNKAKEAIIEQQTMEANRAYFIVGNFKDLRDAGIVNKSGGFIGIGKRQSTNSEMETSKFTMIDKTKVTTITINLKKAQVVSPHPESSYELVMDENDDKVVSYLRILDPVKFWNQTRYLVISTPK